MQKKLKVVATLIMGLIILCATNTYATTNYCGSNIVSRAMSPYSVGKQYLTELCSAYDQCSGKKNVWKSRCDRQFYFSITRKCNSLYGNKKRNAVICLFSAETYRKILTRFAKSKNNTKNVS